MFRSLTVGPGSVHVLLHGHFVNSTRSTFGRSTIFPAASIAALEDQMHRLCRPPADTPAFTAGGDPPASVDS